MNEFNKIVIIYNPNSTGDSKKNAETFQAGVSERLKDVKIVIEATEYAGHAREIAAQYGNDESTVIVSSSGDGGYNEVINGLIDAGGKSAAAVLPSGNANDHYKAVASNDLIANIESGSTRKIEAIKVESTVDGKEWHRFAHSYVGFGLTPKIGKVLTDQRPNILSEKWYVVRHAIGFKHVDLMVDGVKRKYTNIIFATINRMSKVIKLDADTQMNDGMMEVYDTDYVGLIGLAKLVFKASISGISHTKRTDHMTMKTIKPTLVQLDGEVFTFDADSYVTITCHKTAFRTVL